MKFTLLGTGTSQGIPVIGCDCDVCTSADPRDTRRRCSVLIESSTTKIVIDVGPDFRMQMLDAQVSQLDAVLLTHEHNDHVIGLDDLRPLLFRKKDGTIKLHAEKRVLDEIKHRFVYAFTPQPYPGAPSFDVKEIGPYEPLQIGDISVIPLRVMHGELPILGFRIGDFAYLTDTNYIPEETVSMLKGVKVLIIDALRERKHHSHFSLSEATAAVEMIAPERAYFTHISHLLGKTSKWEKGLAKHIHASYDGQVFEL